jgi:putative two-component system response regulator
LSSPPEFEGARILIVDESTNVRFLQNLLGKNGYAHLSSTSDVRSAIGICHENPPDLVLLDMNRPQMNGVESIGEIRDRHLEAVPPVIALTARGDTTTPLRALDAGARDFVGKPFDCPQVLGRVRQVLAAHRLYHRLRAQTETLDESLLVRTEATAGSRIEVIQRLGRAVEYRDYGSQLHIVRLSQIAAHLAAACGLSASQCELMLEASPMHDIGKIDIPDAILLKPGKLSADECRIMRRHPTVGAAILLGTDCGLMRMAGEIALGHHERWDGSGYPDGVAGKRIPLTARIVAVVDVFDALTSRLPYKDAWTVDQALRQLDCLAGNHLDPELVLRFHDILPEVRRIHQLYA